MNFEIRPLSGVLGAEVDGLDLCQELDQKTADQIIQTLLDHQVIIFHEQNISEDDQLRFGQLFGELQVNRTAPDTGRGRQEIVYVTNQPVNGREGILPQGEMHFHNDQCYYERPCKITMLYGMEIPEKGGNTLFLNSCEAHDHLPQDVQERIAGLEVLNVYDYQNNSTVKTKTPRPDAPRFIHPMVVVHPETGRQALYVNRLMTSQIIGMDPSESDKLLEELYTYAEQSSFIYEHVWQSGDLVMWDNRNTMHARTDFDPQKRRTLRRVTVRGGRPVGMTKTQG